MKTRAELIKNLLQAEYEKRLKKQGKYPLRAFAQSLGIDASNLHAIMKGERKAGAKVIRRLGEKIGLSAEEIDSLLAQSSRS